MNYKKPGFTSFEIMMVMAVSAIMMTALLEIYNQVTVNMKRVERFVFEDSQLLALKNRFGKDISGMSSIWYIENKPKADDGAIKQKPKDDDKKMKSKYFYSVNKNGLLDILTFLTTSAVQSYGSVQYRFVRVVYQLENDPKHEGLFRLMRKEILMPSENIDQQALQKGKAYELVHGIKSLDVSYQLVDKIELQRQYDEQKKLQAQEKSGKTSELSVEKKQEPKQIVRIVKQWNLTDIAKDEKKLEKSTETKEDEEDLGGAAVPKFIEMKIVFGKTDQQIEKSYKLDFYVPSVVDNVPKNINKIGPAQSAAGQVSPISAPSGGIS